MDCCAVLNPAAPEASDAGALPYLSSRSDSGLPATAQTSAMASALRAPAPSYDDFVDQAVRDARAPDLHVPVSQTHPLLNGAPYSVFRRDVVLETRRKMGAFFSSSELASALV